MQFWGELLSGEIDAVSSRASCRGRSSVNDPEENRSSAKLSLFVSHISSQKKFDGENMAEI